MQELSIPGTLSARERGRVHGEHFRSQIREITEIRLGLTLDQGKFDTPASVLETAARHLPVLEAFDAPLYEELLGIADGSGLTPSQIVVLNHYTDLKDIDPDREAPSSSNPKNQDEDCTSIVTVTPEGPLLAQTWDMHGSAAPYVCLLSIEAHEGRPALLAFSITGCLALAGLNEAGVGVVINNLKSHDARVGVVWPALVRRILVERNAAAAKHVLMTAPMSSGHHYLIASSQRAYGVETSGERKQVVLDNVFADDDHGTFVHANHCVGDDVGAVSWVSESSTSYERAAWLEASVRERAVASKPDLWQRLGSHDGYPRSVCTHLSSETAPHAMKTCGGILMDLASREIWVKAGCLHEAEPVVHGFEAHEE